MTRPVLAAVVAWACTAAVLLAAGSWPPWAVPVAAVVLVLLIGAVVVLVRMVRQSQDSKRPKGLDAAQRAKALAILQDTDLPK